MKPITFDQWCDLFEVNNWDTDEVESVCIAPHDFIFYDNGAVADQESNFVIKADQVRRKL